LIISCGMLTSCGYLISQHNNLDAATEALQMSIQ